MERLTYEQLEPRQLMHGGHAPASLPDVDGSGKVDNLDFSMVLANWGHATPYGDANGDGTVSNSDFASVIGAWGQTAHTDDAAKQAEHLALLQLFNVRTTTAAVQFGALLTGLPDALRYEPDGVTLATGASLNARGLYVGGTPLPEGSQYHVDKVRGVFVETAG